MASNPLLVTIIALIHHQGGTLPEKRGALYDIATSTFLENWVRQRESERNSNFDKETLVSILAPISYHIHENYTTGLISESELRDLFKKEYQNIYPFQNKKDESNDLKDIINFLREDAGFLFEKGLSEEGEALFGFVHQTFQEYFTSIEFKTRWKEGYYKSGLENYIFNSNWTEVIKLSASLFKLNEQSRLGRQYATKFLNDIIKVHDPLPEIYRPLKLVLQSLIEDTEVEFSFFIEIIDKVFSEILNTSTRFGADHEYNREVSSFVYITSELLETKTYQNYLIERILKELNDNEAKTELKNNLMQILIEKSEIQAIKNELITILKSNRNDLKTLLFNYNVVSPVSEIVFTKEFREAIVKHINTEEFISSYDGHMPTQYHCAFESIKKGDIDSIIKNDSYETFSDKLKEEQLLAIRLIENEKMKIDFINFNVFSIGMSDVNSLNDYLCNLNKEYPKLKFPKIENYIKEKEKFNSYDLNEYETFKYNSVKIYSKKNNPSSYAFMKEEEVHFFDYPFDEADLKNFFDKKTKPFLNFLDLVIPTLITPGSKVSINNSELLLNFIKYQHTIHWHTSIEINHIIQFGFQILFNDDLTYNKTILNWIKTQSEIRYRRFDLTDDFNKKGFIAKVNSSKLSLHDKLFILNLVGEKSDFEDYIIPVIESMNTTKSDEKKKEIKEILYDVL